LLFYKLSTSSEDNKRRYLLKKAELERARILKEKRKLDSKLQKEISELNEEVRSIKNAHRTTIKALGPLHNYLRKKSTFYNKWHLQTKSSFLNMIGLVVFALSFAISSFLLYNPLLKRAMAEAATCTWDGSASNDRDDPKNWTNCNSGVPGETDYLDFSIAITNNLMMTEDKTVARVQAPAATAFAGTFDTNDMKLTVTGDFTWQDGTFDGGDSDIYIGGNVNMTAGAFSSSTSRIVLNGSSNTTFNSSLSLYTLVIEKDNSANTVTLVTNNATVTGSFSLEKGTINTTTAEKVTMTGSGGTHYIGSGSAGGTATVELAYAGQVPYKLDIEVHTLRQSY